MVLVEWLDKDLDRSQGGFSRRVFRAGGGGYSGQRGGLRLRAMLLDRQKGSSQKRLLACQIFLLQDGRV